jgi:threonine dehydrogenase-like Zn-dependent dehydrogenase
VTFCENGQTGCYGLGHALPGSQAEAVAVPAADTGLWRIPEGVSDEDAVVLTDNLPTAWYGAEGAHIRPGDCVAVVGLGPVGLCAVQSAFAMGAARVLGVDLVTERRAHAETLGAIPLHPEDPKQHALELTGGRGVDSVIEAVGADATIQLSLDLVRRGGHVSVVGVNQSRAFAFDMALAQVKSIAFRIGLCSVQAQLPALVPLVESGRIQPSAAVSHHMALDEGPLAYRLFAGREGGVRKVLLTP